MSAELDSQAIAELFEAWCATFNAQKLTELRSYYPTDAVLMPPNAPSIHGPEKIVDDWFGPLLTAYGAEISLAPDEIRSEREWGFVRGTYVVRVAPKTGGEFTEERGSFLDVVSRDRSGKWKIARAIWHSDNKLTTVMAPLTWQPPFAAHPTAGEWGRSNLTRGCRRRA